MYVDLPIWKDSPETPITAESLNLYREAINNLQEHDYIVEQGSNYIKYSSGRLIQWGRNASTISNTTGEVVSVSFPIEFSDIDYCFLTNASTNGTLLTYPLVEGDAGGNSKRTKNGTTVYVRKTQSIYAVSFDWFVIGKWY